MLFYIFIFYVLTVIINVILTRIFDLMSESVGKKYYIIWVLCSPFVLGTVIASLLKDAQNRELGKVTKQSLPTEFISQAFSDCGYNFKKDEIEKVVNYITSVESDVFDGCGELGELLQKIEQFGGIAKDSEGLYFVVESAEVWSEKQN